MHLVPLKRTLHIRRLAPWPSQPYNTAQSKSTILMFALLIPENRRRQRSTGQSGGRHYREPDRACMSGTYWEVLDKRIAPSKTASGRDLHTPSEHLRDLRCGRELVNFRWTAGFDSYRSMWKALESWNPIYAFKKLTQWGRHRLWWTEL